MKKKNISSHNIFHYLLTVVYLLIKSVVASVMWFLLGLGGYFIFQTKRSPFDLVFGLPMMLIGGGFLANSLWTVCLAIFSLTYNRGMCPLCRPVE